MWSGRLRNRAEVVLLTKGRGDGSLVQVPVRWITVCSRTQDEENVLGKRIVRVACLVAFIGMVFAGGFGCTRALDRHAAPPKNVIILIGDGMGFGHVQAGGLYANDKAGSLYLEALPYRGDVVTTPVPKPDAKPGQPAITDSAAAATAMATGHKVYNGVVSMALPGDGSPYQTVLESFAEQGKMTGIVSNAAITDATPAAFGAHAPARGDSDKIVACYLTTVRPNVILGGGNSSEKANLTGAVVTTAGYQLVTNRRDLAELKTEPGCRVFGLFGGGNMPYEAQKVAAATQPDQAQLLDMPGLPEMAQAALKLVSKEPKGFFLMVEGALIDKSANKKGEALCIPEVAEFDEAVKVVMDWAAGRNDTLVIVVADHETGGLKVVGGRGKGQLPEMAWTAGGHTNATVPIFAWGVGAKRVHGTLDNTDVYRLMMGTFRASTTRPTAGARASASARSEQPAAALAD
jgi:alkaline phosphatase